MQRRCRSRKQRCSPSGAQAEVGPAPKRIVLCRSDQVARGSWIGNAYNDVLFRVLSERRPGRSCHTAFQRQIPPQINVARYTSGNYHVLSSEVETSHRITMSSATGFPFHSASPRSGQALEFARNNAYELVLHSYRRPQTITCLLDRGVKGERFETTEAA
jgi:hypothetical protein